MKNLSIVVGMVMVMSTGCAPDGVTDERSAEIAYLGLDVMVEKAMDLGFDGFNSASSANIDDQLADGDLSGTLTVGGQVDQGSSDNKGMRLWTALDGYADVVVVEDDDTEFDVTYRTVGTTDELPALGFTLRDIPDGTLDGTLVGVFEMLGALEGDVGLDLVIEGEIEADGLGGTQRVEGSTSISGTADSDYGSFAVDITL